CWHRFMDLNRIGLSGSHCQLVKNSRIPNCSPRPPCSPARFLGIVIMYLLSRFPFLLGVVLSAIIDLQVPVRAAAQTKQNPKPEDDAPWKHVLTGEDAKKVEKLEKEIEELRKAAKYRDAQTPAREVLAIRTRVQGTEHWQAGDARRVVED